MDNLQKAYYTKWIEQVAENKKLKIELEKYKNLYKKNGDFQKQYLKYKKYFLPLEKAYKEIYDYSILLQNIFDKLIYLYKSKLLLNPLFTDVKIKENEKVEIINETRSLIRKYIDTQIPKRYIIQKEKNEYTCKKKDKLIPVKKDFNLKNFVVKKQK